MNSHEMKITEAANIYHPLENNFRCKNGGRTTLASLLESEQKHNTIAKTVNFLYIPNLCTFTCHCCRKVLMIMAVKSSNNDHKKLEMDEMRRLTQPYQLKDDGDFPPLAG